MSSYPPDAITVRRATAGDLEAAAYLGALVVRVHHATNPKRFFLPDDPEKGYVWWLSKELKRKEAVVLVALLEGRIVGYCYGTLEERYWAILVERHGVLQDIAVDETVRRRGIAYALAEVMIAELTSLGAPRILLRTMVQNEAAQRLFARFGFSITMVEMTREQV